MRRLETARLKESFGRAVVLTCTLAVFAGVAYARDPVRGAARATPCAECHGAPGRAPLAGVPTLAGQQHEFLVLQMFYLREGLREVPSMAGVFKGFTDRDLEDVAAYYARQAPLRPEASANQELHARGADLAKAMACGSCHLPDYRGQKHVPRVANQREDYLVLSLRAYRDDKRTGTDTSMNAAMYQARDADIAALAHYLAHQ